MTTKAVTATLLPLVLRALAGVALLGFATMFFLGYSAKDFGLGGGVRIGAPAIEDELPVISRTEVARKEQPVRIEVLDEVSETAPAEKPAPAKALKADVETLSTTVAGLAVSVDTLRADVTREFGRKVGDLSQIFLGQQLVLFDNAYRSGGPQAPALDHITDFAANVARHASVTAALDALRAVTPAEGPTTRAELPFLLDKALAFGPPAAADQAPVSETVSFWDRLKARALAWFSIRKADGGVVNAEHPWVSALKTARLAAARGDVDAVLTQLAADPLAADSRLDEVRAAFNRHRDQQTKLWAVHQAFIADFRP
jgi:hypothetical protein